MGPEGTTTTTTSRKRHIPTSRIRHPPTSRKRHSPTSRKRRPPTSSNTDLQHLQTVVGQHDQLVDAVADEVHVGDGQQRLGEAVTPDLHPVAALGAVHQDLLGTGPHGLPVRGL